MKLHEIGIIYLDTEDCDKKGILVKRCGKNE
jgi:hypothetical protein